MLAAIVCSALLGSGPQAKGASGEDLASYRAESVKAGRSADAHVRLALWCEARGLSAERAEHLALAVAADPAHAAARGLMGLVEEAGRWVRAEDAGRAGPPAATLDEYRAARDAAPVTARGQWDLSRWCDARGLASQAAAHASASVRIDPDFRPARRRLGFRLIEGRWRTEAEIEKARRDALAQKRADRHWGATLARWRDDLRAPSGAAAAEVCLAGVTDPRAVPSVVRIFGTDDPADQARMVQLLGQVDDAAATKILAAAALLADSEETRRTAAETVIRRDPREFAKDLIAQIRPPIRYEVRPVDGPGSTGILFVEGERFNVRRRYVAPDLPALARQLIAQREAGVLFGPDVTREMVRGGGGSFDVVADRRDRAIAHDLAEVDRAARATSEGLADDVRSLDLQNARTARLNERARSVLALATGQDHGADREAWSRWWSDREGYAYVSPPTRPKPTIDQVATRVQPNFATAPPPDVLLVASSDCFAAGTTVRTRDGDRPIEGLKVGDLVLAQDVESGRLGFEPIVAVYHNPPVMTLRVDLGSDAVVASGVHRFWTPGKGWTMARDLKPGDAVRTTSGSSKVRAVEPVGVQPVYNLEVAGARTFFVGKAGSLVHDHGPVESTPEPFDGSR